MVWSSPLPFPKCFAVTQAGVAPVGARRRSQRDRRPRGPQGSAHTPRGPGPLGMSDCFCASPLGRGRVCLRGLGCSAAERHCTWLHAKPSGSGSPRSVSVLLGPVPFPISVSCTKKMKHVMNSTNCPSSSGHYVMDGGADADFDDFDY